MRKGRKQIGILVAALLVGAGCDDDGITTPGAPPAAEGILAGVNGCDFTQPCAAVVPDSIWQVWVKADQDDNCGVLFAVDRGTDLLIREGTALRRAAPEEFTPWRPVRAWSPDGAVADSCPGQATARAVELR